ncbi:MAG: GDSL-type esterase/lipase family protein [Candidatus Bathyarchaeota archaeon]|nr:GDSL-type esterase/lipase family protein [Candidatus Bathyarchaeota archaeon]
MNKKDAGLVAAGLAILFIASATVYFSIFASQNQHSFLSNTLRIACVGDSLTQSSGYPYELWKLLGSSAQYTVGNYSVTPKNDNGVLHNGTRFAVGNFGAGSTTVLLNTETPYMNTSIFQSALDFQPNIILIMLGTNDAQPNLEPYNASFVADYVKLITAFQALPSKPKIWVMLPPPVLSNQSGPGRIDPEYFANTIIPNIEQAANITNVPIIDLYTVFAGHFDYYSDGVHVNSAGARLIASEVYKTLSLTDLR